MAAPASIADYFRMYGSALGDHVLSRFPALHGPADPASPALLSEPDQVTIDAFSEVVNGETSAIMG